MKTLIATLLLTASLTAIACDDEPQEYDILCVSKCIDADFGIDYCRRVCAI